MDLIKTENMKQFAIASIILMLASLSVMESFRRTPGKEMAMSAIKASASDGVDGTKSNALEYINLNFDSPASSGLKAYADSTPPVPQKNGVRRKDLQRYDLSSPRREVIQTRIDFDPGVAFGNHSHPGEEIIYVIEGLFEYKVEGKPPVTLKAGDVLFIPAGVVHAAKNVGTGNAAELATYVVEKGKPLLVMAK